MNCKEKLLEVRDLHKVYTKEGVPTKALNGITFNDICISCRLDPPAGNLNLQTQENRHRLSMFPVRAG